MLRNGKTKCFIVINLSRTIDINQPMDSIQSSYWAECISTKLEEFQTTSDWLDLKDQEPHQYEC